MELSKEYKSLSLILPCERKSEEFELDYQENLPAYLDDANKIIKCTAKCSLVDYEINSGCITIYGKTLICLTYVSSQGFLLSNIFEEDFSKSIDIEKNDGVCFADICIVPKYSSSRLINQRRIDVHISLTAQIKCFEKNAVNTLQKCENAFTKDMSADILVNKYSSVTSVDFDEVFTVPGASQIKNIINIFTSSCIEEYKVIKEKMLVKLKTQVSLLYMTDEDSIERFLYSFTSSKIIDVPDSDEEDKALLSSNVSSLYIKAKPDSNNKLSEIEVVGKISVYYMLTGCENETLITDAYMAKNEIKTETDRITLLTNPKYYNDDAVAQVSVQTDGEIREVLDFSAEVLSCTVSASVLKYSVKVALLFFDGEGNIRFTEKVSEQEMRLESTDRNGVVAINIVSSDYVISGENNVNIKVNFEYAGYLFDSEGVSFISDIEITGEKDLSHNLPLTLYFAEQGESVWNIAKEFSASPQTVRDENGISGDTVREKKIILISKM